MKFKEIRKYMTYSKQINQLATCKGETRIGTHPLPTPLPKSISRGDKPEPAFTYIITDSPPPTCCQTSKIIKTKIQIRKNIYKKLILGMRYLLFIQKFETPR